MSVTKTTRTTTTNINDFENLLEPGKEPSMIKPYRAQCVQMFEKQLNPHTLKRHVLQTDRITRIINYYAEKNTESTEHVKNHVFKMINEIALDRNLAIIRCCGIAITAIGKRICDAIYVNKMSINGIKNNLKNHNNPVLYLPSHRSYMDFILMSYICFNYDIEIPGIAAGMDFHSMFGMGTMLRKTGAFFMRRSFSNDELYWDVFREYMYALVAHYHIGVEFFIEGTRSRNFKALKPKVGLLSMALLPYFTGEVDDITVIPVSISYDRLLEEELFVYELLGVPKPKESTKGFFKALKIIDERFGSMYIDFGKPISVRKFFNDSSATTSTSTTTKTLLQRANIASSLQKLNKREIGLIKQLANEVVYQQQRGIVLSTFNLICLYYACQLYLKVQQKGNNQNSSKTTNTIIRIDTLPLVLLEMKEFFEKLGACVATTTNNSDNNNLNLLNMEILNVLKIHENIMELHNNGGNFKLKQLAIDNLNQFIAMQRLKAHALKVQTMAIAVPIISMQLYINPTLFWLAKPAYLLLAALSWQRETQKQTKKHNQLLLMDLKGRTLRIEEIFKYEFIINHSANSESTTNTDFMRILQFLQEQHIINLGKTTTTTTTTKMLLSNIDLNVHHNNSSHIILAALAPFLCLYYQLSVTLSRLSANAAYTIADIMVLQQQRIEQLMLINDNTTCAKLFVHPYCLALDNLHVAMNYFQQENYLLPHEELSKTNKKIPLYCLNGHRPLEPLVQELHNYCEILTFQQYFEAFNGIQSIAKL